MSEQAPLAESISANVPGVAAGVVQDLVIGTAPFAGTVTAVRFAAEATLTGAATNFRTLRLLNKGSDGLGTTVVASLAFNSTGVVATAFDEKEITLSAVAGATTVADGDVLVWDETVAATGLATPGGAVTVDLARS